MVQLLVIVIALAAVVYAERRWHPMRRCPSCGGRKTNFLSTMDRWGICGRCGGKGEVRRFGAGKGQ